MAGIGAAPKDPSVRRNKSAPLRGEWVDLEPLSDVVLPELDGQRDWPQPTVMLWEAWRSDPVTSQYSPSDVAYALETIALHASGKAKHAELRLRMDGLGLTPKGKRDLRWRIPGQAVAPVVPRQPSAGSADRRSRLSLA